MLRTVQSRDIDFLPAEMVILPSVLIETSFFLANLAFLAAWKYINLPDRI